jgi:hypothetical protein
MFAATSRLPGEELNLVATFRGEQAAVVRSLTNNILVPADAEAVLEGYLDEHGYVEPEGPFGEYMGYYGAIHMDPVFHCTAITMRRDAMFSPCCTARVLAPPERRGANDALRTEAVRCASFADGAHRAYTCANSGGQRCGLDPPAVGRGAQRDRVVRRHHASEARLCVRRHRHLHDAQSMGDWHPFPADEDPSFSGA